MHYYTLTGESVPFGSACCVFFFCVLASHGDLTSVLSTMFANFFSMCLSIHTHQIYIYIYISMHVSLFEFVWRKHHEACENVYIYEVSAKNWRHQSEGVSVMRMLTGWMQRVKKKIVKISTAFLFIAIVVVVGSFIVDVRNISKKMVNESK